MAIQRVVKFSTSPIHLPQCIEAAEVPLQVQHRPIQAFYEWRPIPSAPAEPGQLPDGASVVVHIRPSIDLVRPDHDEGPFGDHWRDAADDDHEGPQPRDRSCG